MMKEKYISEAALKDEPKKKLSLKIKEGSITPEHFNKKEVDAYLLDVVGAIEETGMLPEDKAKLDALPTAEELEKRLGKIFIVNVEGPANREYIADKTYQETFAALTENKMVAFNTTYGVFFADADASSPVIFASKYYAHDGVDVVSRAMLLTYTEASGIRIESADLQKALTFDDAPVSGSSNPVKSKGIKSALDTLDGKINSVSSDLSDLSDNVNGFDSRIDTVETTAKTLKTNYDNINKTVNANVKNIDTLKKKEADDLKSLSGLISDNDNAIKQLKQDLTNNVNTINDSIASLSSIANAAKILAEENKKKLTPQIKDFTLNAESKTEITFEEEIINKHVKLLVKDKETTSLTYGMYINSEGVATVAYKGDKKTLVVSNESVLNMDFHLVVY